MATIGSDPNGCKRILFVSPDGKRKTVRLGKVTMKQATAFKVRLEALIGQTITGVADDEISRWVAGLDAEMYSRLAAVGLVKPRAAATVVLLADFLDAYCEARRPPVQKPHTFKNLNATRRQLLEFFGRDRDLRSITPGDADAWLLDLGGRYASTTCGRTIKRAKQFFRAAVRSRIIAENPFGDCKAPSQVNESRKCFVSQEAIGRILDACPDSEWRLIVALARYGGIRCPSELVLLEWSEVDWERSRFLVHAPKTEHHEGGGERWVPIFPELLPYLAEAFQQAEDGTRYLINRAGDPGVNLRAPFLRIIRRAGESPWPKLFVNLRASRETELVAEYPLHVVCKWLGNSTIIAQKHYLQVTEADFQRAAGGGLRGAESGTVDAEPTSSEAAQIPAQSAANGACQRKTAFPAETRNVLEVNDLLPESIPVSTHKYPPRES
jgi:integrase